MVRLVHTVLCTGDEPVRNDLIQAVGGEIDGYGLTGRDGRRGGAMARRCAMVDSEEVTSDTRVSKLDIQKPRGKHGTTAEATANSSMRSTNELRHWRGL